jgi:hypothetical protein
MQSLLDAPERVRVMGAHSRRMAEEHYDVEMVTRRIMVELGRSVLPGLRRKAPERPLRRGWRRLL